MPRSLMTDEEMAAFDANLPPGVDRETWGAISWAATHANDPDGWVNIYKPEPGDLTGRFAQYIGATLKRAEESGRDSAKYQIKATAEQRATALAHAATIYAGSATRPREVLDAAQQYEKYLSGGKTSAL